MSTHKTCSSAARERISSTQAGRNSLLDFMPVIPSLNVFVKMTSFVILT